MNMLSSFRQQKYTSCHRRCCLDSVDGEPVVFECKIFTGHTTLKLLWEVQTLIEKKITFSHKISRIESSSCRCTTTSIGARKAIKKVVNVIPQILPNMPKSFPEDIGHSSDLDLKKKGMLRSPIIQMVCGTRSPKNCGSQLQRACILYSEEQVIHPEDH